MDNLARLRETATPVLGYGHILEQTATGFSVRTDAGDVDAIRSVSCLVRPMPGDEVLLSMDQHGRTFVLAVLERQESLDTELDFAGKVRLCAQGDVDIAAANDLALLAGEHCMVAGRRLDVLAEDGEAKVGKMRFIGNILHAQVQALNVVAGNVENVFIRLTQRFKDMFRYVEDHSEVQAGSARYLVDETLTMHSKNAVHMAEEVVKVDGEQVHLG